MAVAEKIKKIRTENGLSQEEMAELLEVSRQTISKWENNICLPDTESMILLCKKFSCTPNDILIEDNTLYQNNDPNLLDNQKYEKESTGVSFKAIFLFPEMALLCLLYILSRIFPSNHYYETYGEIENIAMNSHQLESYTSSYQGHGFADFLTTYHLWFLVFLLCAAILFYVLRYLFILHQRRTK